MSSWLFDVYMNALIKEVKMGIGRMGVRFLEWGREWRLPGLFYGDVLILCTEYRMKRGLEGCAVSRREFVDDFS